MPLYHRYHQERSYFLFNIRNITKIMSDDGFWTTYSRHSHYSWFKWSSAVLVCLFLHEQLAAPKDEGNERDGEHYRNWIPFFRLLSSASSSFMTHAHHRQVDCTSNLRMYCVLLWIEAKYSTYIYSYKDVHVCWEICVLGGGCECTRR